MYIDNVITDSGDVLKIRDNLLMEMDDEAGFHNSLYRGKYLGNTVTAVQYDEIGAGTFGDLFIGDYWTISSVNYRIAAFDYWLHTGDTECTDHHVLLVPDTGLYISKMNDSDTTNGGYIGSKMYTTQLESAKTTIKAAFGAAHILAHREYFVNAVDSGKPSAVAWYDSDVDLMNESMVIGHPLFGVANDGNTIPVIGNIDNVQLSLFVKRPDLITIRNIYWLRDTASATNFCLIDDYGRTGTNQATKLRYVRPAFAIYKPAA